MSEIDFSGILESLKGNQNFQSGIVVDENRDIVHGPSVNFRSPTTLVQEIQNRDKTIESLDAQVQFLKARSGLVYLVGATGWVAAAVVYALRGIL